MSVASAQGSGLGQDLDHEVDLQAVIDNNGTEWVDVEVADGLSTALSWSQVVANGSNRSGTGRDSRGLAADSG